MLDFDVDKDTENAMCRARGFPACSHGHEDISSQQRPTQDFHESDLEPPPLRRPVEEKVEEED